jgi:hypothetical protein
LFEKIVGIKMLSAQSDEKISGLNRARICADMGDGEVRITQLQPGSG